MTDFYEEDDPDCCLICENAKEGCLCFDCKCGQCEAYSKFGVDPDEVGHCEWTVAFRQINNNKKWDTFIPIEFELKGETEKANLIKFNNSSEIWIPKSHFKDNSIRLWFLEKKKIPYKKKKISKQKKLA